MTDPHPDRIDFKDTGEKILVTKFYRIDGKDRPDPNGANVKPADFDMKWALAWCEQNGYTVRRWYNGGRAWKGTELWPVRTRSRIKRCRRELERMAQSGMYADANLLSMDLRYDW